MGKLRCGYCDKEQTVNDSVVNAGNGPGWVMNESTGKVSCPDCYYKAEQEARKAIYGLRESIESLRFAD